MVVLDILFRDADLLFVSPTALNERGEKENPLFGFFLSQIHTKLLSSTGCLRKNALLGFLNPWDRLMPVVTIVLVKVVGGMLDDD